MQVETAWVKPAATGRRSRSSRRSGALRINIYGRLLPGITNVTDRARYYSFYPWLIWAFDEAGFTRYDDEFIERFRRADCLFSLIAERHAATAGGPYEDHAAAMVGSNTWPPSPHRWRATGRLLCPTIHFATERGHATSSIAWVGLGSTYLGVLRELSILDGDTTRGIKYTRQVGEKIAASVDAGVNRARFLPL